MVRGKENGGMGQKKMEVC